MRSIVRTILPSFALLLLVTLTALAQDPQGNQSPPPGGGGPDLLEQLRLTPEQRQRIRMIQRDTKDERAAIGLRLREANRALEDALDAETIDDNVIEQRMQAVSVAQAAQLRLRIQTEVRIKRVLNPEQLAFWRDLRLKAADVLRGRQDNPRPLRPGANGLRPNQRNGIAPLEPQNQPVRNPRP
jgi:Spy/CpxP family protein refolding chaperone